MLKTIKNSSLIASALLAASFAPTALAADDYKLGLVTFLSGGAAGPFGVPAKMLPT